jgi:hypothetical protein
VFVHKSACCSVQNDEGHALVDWKHIRAEVTVGNMDLTFSTILAQHDVVVVVAASVIVIVIVTEICPTHRRNHFQHQYCSPVILPIHIAQ